MRTYIPEWGCFTGPDMRIEVGEENGACNYLFAGNNPLVFMDPTGLAEIAVVLGTDINNSSAIQLMKEKFQKLQRDFPDDDIAIFDLNRPNISGLQERFDRVYIMVHTSAPGIGYARHSKLYSREENKLLESFHAALSRLDKAREDEKTMEEMKDDIEFITKLQQGHEVRAKSKSGGKVSFVFEGDPDFSTAARIRQPDVTQPQIAAHGAQGGVARIESSALRFGAQQNVYWGSCNTRFSLDLPANVHRVTYVAGQIDWHERSGNPYRVVTLSSFPGAIVEHAEAFLENN